MLVLGAGAWVQVLLFACHASGSNRHNQEWALDSGKLKNGEPVTNGCQGTGDGGAFLCCFLQYGEPVPCVFSSLATRTNDYELHPSSSFPLLNTTDMA